MRQLILISIAILGLSACESTDLSPVPTAISADNINRSATIVNDTPISMAHLRARNAESGQWTTGLFDRTRLPANSERTIRIDDGSNSCMYSFHASMSNGQKVSNLAVNVCGGGVWRIYIR